MTDPSERRGDLDQALEVAAAQARAFLAGRVFAGTTVFEDKVAFRPAIVNWRTRPEDVDALVDVLLELAPSVGNSGSGRKRREPS